VQIFSLQQWLEIEVWFIWAPKFVLEARPHLQGLWNYTTAAIDIVWHRRRHHPRSTPSPSSSNTNKNEKWVAQHHRYHQTQVFDPTTQEHDQLPPTHEHCKREKQLEGSARFDYRTVTEWHEQLTTTHHKRT
jgi:hypothetical protein